MAATQLGLCFLAFLSLSLIGCAEGGEYCFQNNYASATYCEGGCCGSGGYESCCSYVSVGLIVGCVFAGITVISIIIAVVCCCIKKKTHQGKVISPTTLPPRPAGTVTTTTYPQGAQPTVYHTGYAMQTTPHHMHGQPLPPVAPPPYQAPPPPPAYSMYPQQGQGQGQGFAGQGAYQYGQGHGQAQPGAPPYPSGGQSASAFPATTPAPGGGGQPTTQYGNNFIV